MGDTVPPPVLAILFFFFTLVIGPRRSLSLKLIDTRVYEPQMRARLGDCVLLSPLLLRQHRSPSEFAQIMSDLRASDNLFARER